MIRHVGIAGLLLLGACGTTRDDLRYLTDDIGNPASQPLPGGGAVMMLRVQTDAGWHNNVVGMMPVVTQGGQTTIGGLNMAVVPTTAGWAADAVVTLGASLGAVAIPESLNLQFKRNSIIVGVPSGGQTP